MTSQKTELVHLKNDQKVFLLLAWFSRAFNHVLLTAALKKKQWV